MSEVSAELSMLADICTSIENKNGEILSLKEDVTRVINGFPDVWKGEAEKTFEDDYNTIMISIQSASEAMTEITNMMRGYVNDLQTVEDTYGSGPHVTIG